MLFSSRRTSYSKMKQTDRQMIDVRKPRSFSLRLYLFIVFGLSWPFQIVSALLAGGLLPTYLLNASSMVMVAVGTFIAGKYVFRDGFAGAGWRWGKPWHYAVVIGLVMILWILPELVELWMGTVSLPGSLSRRQGVWIFVLLVVTLIPAFGEEVGWRGYMLPRLVIRMKIRRAVVLQGFIWWAWHLPLLVIPKIQALFGDTKGIGIELVISATGSAAVIVIASAIPVMLHGVVFAYIWSYTRSLAVVTFYHALYDGVRDSLQTTMGCGPVASIWVTIVLAALGILLLKKGNWKNLSGSN